MTGLSKFDPFLADIKSAVKDGYFDRQIENGPSELMITPVEELLRRVEMMSPARRRNYLAEIGDFRTNSTKTLSGTQGQKNEPTAKWLNRRRG